MEIHRLHLALTEQDLNDLIRHHLLDDVPVEDLEIRIGPDGVRVKGVYQLFVPVSFEALWEPGVDQGRPTARLSTFKTMGMPLLAGRTFDRIDRHPLSGQPAPGRSRSLTGVTLFE